MKFLIPAILLILPFSCKINKSEKQNNGLEFKSSDCQELVNFLKKSWRKDKDGYFFFEQKPTDYNKYYIMPFMRDCIIGLTKKEVKKIFGEPSAHYAQKDYYYMSKECAEGNPPHNFTNSCFLTTIQFDKNDQVIGFWGGTRFVKPGY